MQLKQFLLCASLAVAQDIRLPVSNTLAPGPVDKPAALQAFTTAGQSPNATSSLSFSQSWAWRINITDLAIPNSISDLGDPSASFSKGLRVTNTQWNLQWPNNSSSPTLQSYLFSQNLSLNIAALSLSLPSNLSAPADNGSCTPLLGDACERAITSALTGGSPIQQAFPECASSIGINGFTQPGASGTRLRGGVEPAVYSNSTVFYTTSKTYTRGESTEFDRAKGAVQILALGFEGENKPEPILVEPPMA
jgi:hypothetical protein